MEKGELLTTNEKYAILCKDSFSLVIKELKGFMKALKAFIKPFEAPQKKCENKHLSFYFNTTFGNTRDGKD